MQAPIRRETGVCAQSGRPCVWAWALQASSANRLAGRRQVWWSQIGLSCAPMIDRRLGRVRNDLDGPSVWRIETRGRKGSLSRGFSSAVFWPVAVRENCPATNRSAANHSGDRRRLRRTASPGQKEAGRNKEPQASIGPVVEAGRPRSFVSLRQQNAKNQAAQRTK